MLSEVARGKKKRGHACGQSGVVIHAGWKVLLHSTSQL